MPKLSNRYSRFSFSDYKNQYTQLKKSHLREVNEEPDAFTEEPLSSIPEPPSGTQSRSLENPYNIEIWDIWNTKAEKYYYPNGQEEGQDSTQQVDSLQVMLAYEHEYTLFVARHPTYIQDMIPLDEREGAIFVIFSSFALYWKQFLAKVIALGILGQLKGKKLYIYTCYGWRKSKLMDVLAGQYGFKWRLCADMDKLGYSHPDILLACEYSNKVTLESLLKVSPTSLDRYKDVAQEESIPLQLKFVVAPCGAKDYKLFMASAWTLALKIFQSSSFENSSSPMNGNKSNKDFRLDLGRSSWFSKLYNLYVASKIDIDAQGNFFETNLEQQLEADKTKIFGAFKELAPMNMEPSPNIFASVNLDKILNYKFPKNGSYYSPGDKPAAMLFLDLIKGDGFDYTPPIEWIVAETVLHTPKGDLVPALKRRTPSLRRISFLSAVLIHSESTQDKIFRHLHEDFKVDLSHILGNSLKYGNFFKPVAYFTEAVPETSAQSSTKTRKEVFLNEALANGQLSRDDTISLKELFTVLDSTKKAAAQAKKLARRTKTIE